MTSRRKFLQSASALAAVSALAPQEVAKTLTEAKAVAASESYTLTYRMNPLAGVKQWFIDDEPFDGDYLKFRSGGGIDLSEGARMEGALHITDTPEKLSIVGVKDNPPTVTLPKDNGPFLKVGSDGAGPDFYKMHGLSLFHV